MSPWFLTVLSFLRSGNAFSTHVLFSTRRSRMHCQFHFRHWQWVLSAHAGIGIDGSSVVPQRNFRQNFSRNPFFIIDGMILCRWHFKYQRQYWDFIIDIGILSLTLNAISILFIIDIGILPFFFILYQWRWDFIIDFKRNFDFIYHWRWDFIIDVFKYQRHSPLGFYHWRK